MHLFYSNNTSNKNLILSENESNHCVLVMRKKIGDKILITNGQGVIYSAIIQNIEKKIVQCKLLEIISENLRKKYVHIAIAPPKNKTRFEWFLEKATEIGIDEISPLICEKSEKKTINQKRSEQILISAMKQCQSGVLPKLNRPITFNDFIQKTTNPTFIAHCFQKNNKLNFKNILQKKPKLKKITVLIGPEGDFTLKEINYSAKFNIKAISLSSQRLRTETAAIVTCNMIEVLL